MTRASRLPFLLLLLPALALPAPLAADPPIRLKLGAEGHVRLTGLPPVLADEEVAEQLTSGLTTTFVFRVDLLRARGGKAVGGARVEVRYELWDEVFHASVIDIGGRARPEVLASRELLNRWWSTLELQVLDRRRLQAESGAARVLLDVVPFSRAEIDDTQRWFAQRAAQGAGKDDAVTRSPEDRSGSLEQIFSVLLATSIQHRSLISYRWVLDLPSR